MQFILLSVIVLQLGYIVYSDIQNRRERERLQLKLMSKDLVEYTDAVGGAEEPSTTIEEDPYLSIEEASVEQVVGAREK